MKEDAQILDSGMTLASEHDPLNEEALSLMKDFIIDVDYGIPEIEYEEKAEQPLVELESTESQLTPTQNSLEQQPIDDQELAQNSGLVSGDSNQVKKTSSLQDLLIV